MTDLQYDNVEPLSGSSEPTGSAPTFEPIAAAHGNARSEAVSNPNRLHSEDEAILALAEEIVELAKREDADALFRAQNDMPAADPSLFEQLMMKVSLLSLISAQSAQALAAKGRVALGIGGSFEGSERPEETALLKSLATDAVRLGSRAPDVRDAELIAFATGIGKLAAEENKHFASSPDLEDDHPDQVAWQQRADEITEQFRDGIEKLAAMPASTAKGLAAKSATLLEMKSMFESIDWLQESDLVRSVVGDAIRMGQQQSTTSIALPSPVAEQAGYEHGDQELIAFAHEVRDLAIREHEQCDQLSELCDRLDELSPPEPQDRTREAVDAAIDELQRMEAAVEVHTDETARASLAASHRVRDAIFAESQAEVAKYHEDLGAISIEIGHRAAEELHTQLFKTLKERTRQLTAMPATTIAGLAAKAEASIEINRGNYDTWTTDLSDMLAREVVMIASSRRRPDGGDVSGDAALIELASRMRDAHAEQSRLFDLFEIDESEEASKICDAAFERSGAICNEIEAMHATTLGGLKAQLSALVWIHDNPKSFTAEDLFNEKQPAGDVRLVVQMLNDLRAMAVNGRQDSGDHHDRAATAKDVAAMEFEPLSDEDNACPPSKAEWIELHDSIVPYLRIGFVLLGKTKRELVEAVDGMTDPDHWENLVKGLSSTQKWLTAWGKYAEMAYTRLLSATAVAAEGCDHQEAA